MCNIVGVAIENEMVIDNEIFSRIHFEHTSKCLYEQLVQFACWLWVRRENKTELISNSNYRF